MQINPSQQNSAEVIRDVPARLLASLADGERVQATVVAKLNGQSVKIQVADTVLQLISQQPLQAGQKIELQRSVEAGRAVLKIVAVDPAIDAERPVTLNASLKPGQQFAVEVIKLLAQNRLLVSPSLITDSHTQKTQAGHTAIPQTLPRQIEVDISALRQSFKPGDKLALEVIQTQPLAIKLRADSPSRAALIQSYQRNLLPQIDTATPPLATLNKALAEPVLVQPLRQEITRLFQGLTDKAALQRPEALQQTINNSGAFLESFLKTNPGSVTNGQDFKANLLQLAQALKQQLQQPLLNRVIDNPEVMKKLPVEVQTALRQLAAAPQDLRPLPAQVPPALASKGQTPMQLLLGLLSGLRSAVATTDKPLAPPSLTALSTTQGQSLSGLQALMNGRESQTQLNQNTVRFVEWQMMRDMLREVESASARIQFNQLSMLRDPDTANNVNVWLFDLPVKDKQQLEMLQLRLEQHSPDLTGGEEAIWQVQLNLETQNLGPMQARISLHQQDVKVVILAERSQSAEILSRYLDDLNARLQKLEVSISHLSCRQAVIQPLTTDIQPGQTGDHLLDISV